jgi:Hint module
VWREGLFNPQTLHGDVVVDGLRASSYTTAVEPAVAHRLLWPLRVLFERTGRYARWLDGGGSAAVLAAAPSGNAVC